MSKVDLSFTGERVVEGKTPQRLFEDHLLRYQLVADHVTGKCVLDIACGTGYGSYHLRQRGAIMVYGIDISEETVAYAREHYGEPELSFMVGNAENIPFSDQSVDVVACIETFEHVPNYESLLNELHRVVHSDGLVFFSTPNRRLSSPGRGLQDPPFNKYHVREFTVSELIEILSPRFEHIYIEGQRFVPRAFLLPWVRRLTKAGLPGRFSSRRGPLSPFFEPHYLMIWCRFPRDTGS